ncbi:MAG: GT2 family glycosyltransferase [Halocynthiibacter sp.]|jgi:GT2 family glycosyltransferase
MQNHHSRLAAHHDATLIELSQNIGFGPACNRGAQAAKTEFIFFLNPDAELGDGAIDALLAAASRHPKGAAFSPRIANANGSAFFKRRSVLLPKSQWLAKGWPESEVTLPVLSGSAIFLRRADFAPFDPNIFMYHEDDDWSINHAKTTGPLIFVPAANVLHDAGHSSGRAADITKFKAYHLGRSRVYSMVKYEVPLAFVRSVMAAGFGLLSPLVLLSKRKRAKAIGFWNGVTSNAFKPNPKLAKIGFELARIVKQIKALPYNTFHTLTATLRYDLVTSKKMEIHTGDVLCGDKVAIYLIFPKDGVAPSHFHALEYIKAAGYSPFLVSNLALSDADRTKLKALCWQVMERPNVGYDFGGYRDAVLSMKSKLASLDRLAILNDSAWFPLGDHTNWLTDAEDLNVDFAGAACSNCVARIACKDFMDIKWDFNYANRNFHYGSYAVSIGPKLLKAPVFFKFWKRIKLTANKAKVVRRGEIALSKLVVRNKFTHGATADLRDLPTRLTALSFARLKDFADELIYLEEPRMKAVHTKALEKLHRDSETEARDILEKLILTVISRHGAPYAAPRLMIELFGFQFLKKAPLKSNKRDSETLKQVAETFSGPSGDAINREAQAIRTAHFSGHHTAGSV